MTIDIRPTVIRVTVTDALAGERLDKAIAALVPALSRTKVREILNRGGVWSGDRRLRASSMAVPAQTELTVLYPPDFTYPQLELGNEDVLWEDEWLLAIRKQAGWYVQPTAWDLYGNVESALSRYLDRRGDRGCRLHLTHRLDKETSGVLITSKRSEINAPLQKLWSAGGVEKIYTALVAGSAPPAWRSDEPLGPGPNARYRVDHLRGRPAITEFKTLAAATVAGRPYAELEARPKTGRTHQIRIHAAHSGAPLLGDVRYAGLSAIGERSVPRVMLHAAALRLRHPKTGRELSLEAAPPEDYAALRAFLGLVG